MARPASQAGVRVLLYHAIDRPDPADRMGLRVSPEAFRAQLTLLRDEGYRVVPLARALDGSCSNEARCVAISFDDGYRSEVVTAAILGEFGFAATFFVVPRFLDGVKAPAHYWEAWPHMDWDNAAALAAAGFEIGAHSMTHPDLTRCDAVRLADEVGGVKTMLEARLARQVDSFSFPYGRHNSDVRQAAARAGYRLACTSRYGVNSSSGRCYELARTEVGGTDRLVDFRHKLQGKYDWLARWQELK